VNVKDITALCCPSFLKPLFCRIENSPVGLRFARGVFWSMAGAVISRGLMFIATVSVARILGKTGYGELGMIQSTVGLFGAFAGFGLGLTATKHVAEFRQNDPERAGRIIGLSWLVAMFTGGLMAFGLFIFAPWLADHAINAPHLAGVLRIGALILFISALNGAQTGALSGFEAFKTIAYVNIFVGLLSFPILIGGAYFGGLTGAVWAMAINLGFNWLFCHVALGKESRRYSVPVTFNHCSREIPILWRFSLPAVLSGVMVGPAHWVCRALLANKHNGYDELGSLTAALVFQQLLMFISGMLATPLLAMISNAGPNISKNLGLVNILSSWILGVIVAIPLLCFPEVAQAIFGKAYDTHNFKVTLSLVVFCTSVMTFNEGLARVLAANSLLWWGFFGNAFWAAILIVSTVFLVDLGALGLAASLTVAYILDTIVLLPLYHFRNLIPKGTLFSIKSVMIWCILSGLVLLNIADVSLLIRSITFLPCMMLAGIAFMRIYKEETA